MANLKNIAVFMHDFRGGGAERVSVRLCNGLVERKEVNVTIFVINAAGPMLQELCDEVKVIELSSKRMAFSFWELSKKIRGFQPDLVISHMTHANVTACLAAIMGRFADKLIIVEHNQMKHNFQMVDKLTVKIAYQLTKWFYNIPKRIIAVSSGVKKSIIEFAGVDAGKVSVIYNPVVSDELKKYIPVKGVDLHNFYTLDVPVFIGVGSLTKQKNFPLFLRALKCVNQTINVKAIILGEGPERESLEEMVRGLELEGVVDLPGFVTTPYDYIANADTFVLSSSWEGLPTVIIEAIALNTNVVSTNCPSGPDEILNSGEFGALVDMDDETSLAEAMINSLSKRKFELAKRAEDFSVEKSVNDYYMLISGDK